MDREKAEINLGIIVRYYFSVVQSGSDRGHYPAIQVLDVGAATPQALGMCPINETSRDATFHEEEQNVTEFVTRRLWRCLLRTLAELRKRT